MEKDIGHICIFHISLRFEVSFILIWDLGNSIVYRNIKLWKVIICASFCRTGKTSVSCPFFKKWKACVAKPSDIDDFFRER